MNGLGKSARNERRKLEAQTINAIGLAFGIGGFVQPVLSGDVPPLALLKMTVAGLIGYILHRYAIWYMARLED